MNLPFTTDQFLSVFKEYNQSLWPTQVILILIALLLLYFLFREKIYSNGLISAGLALFWLWMGIVYHLIFFSQINPAAKIFGALFIIQAVLFIYYGIIKHNLEFKYKKNIIGFISIVFFLYALIFYPLLGFALGNRYPEMPTFGLPCPTTIFTFGLIMLLENRKKQLFIIPILWSIIGFGAAIKLGIFQDIGLLIAGAASLVILFIKD